jgi:hypothetical protein
MTRPCGKAMMQTVPTRYSAKLVPARCGQTSIYGDMLLCEECEKVVPNPPAYTYEDAGEADFEPFRESDLW